MRGFLSAIFIALAVQFPLAHQTVAAEAAKPGVKANRLLNAPSPYLRQHAYNPVDWHMWGPEAFAKAKAQNKPIFLSVGYSTCHWCHVMARESFADADVAKILNAHFIAIKVDRERRPDVDATYMLATELITRTGGWPNSVFLTPDLKPFYAGTYFPKPAFLQVLTQLSLAWRDQREQIDASADNITKVIAQYMTRRKEAKEVTVAALKAVSAKAVEKFDEFEGGYGSAPKFPRETLLLFLLRMAERHGDEGALAAVTLTLDSMLDGGIHDHVGGGFHRYSVDNAWLVPHFEKMLYNQALMARVLLRAYRLTGNGRYGDAARRTLDYVLRDLRGADGAFYSAFDADSEGHEGTFYLWTPEQLRVVLGEKDSAFATKAFGVTAKGNFEGKNILHFPDTLEHAASNVGLDSKAFIARVGRLRDRLRLARRQRVKPHRDEKTVLVWHALMVAAMAEGADILKEPRFRRAAVEGGQFIWNKLRKPTGKPTLLRSFFHGKATLPAQQEDYAATSLAMIALYDLTAERIWLERAKQVSDRGIELFRDEKVGDFFIAPASKAFGRVKSPGDAQIPSGSAMALDALAKLARRSARPEDRFNGERLLAALSGHALESALDGGYTLLAADVMLRGETGARRFLAKGVVRATARLEEKKAGGWEFRVTLEVADGWHVNAHKPLEDFFIPTELLALKGAKTTGVAATYPAPLVRRLGFHDKKLALYEGSVVLRLALPSGKTSAKLVRAKLRLQACSDKICLEPETVVLSVSRALAERNAGKLCTSKAHGHE